MPTGKVSESWPIRTKWTHRGMDLKDTGKTACSETEVELRGNIKSHLEMNW